MLNDECYGLRVLWGILIHIYQSAVSKTHSDNGGQGEVLKFLFYNV